MALKAVALTQALWRLMVSSNFEAAPLQQISPATCSWQFPQIESYPTVFQFFNFYEAIKS
jgi:hypothetical protein